MENAKIGGVIISHGRVANELLTAAEAVVGELEHITSVSIEWHDDVDSAKDEIARAIKKVSKGKGVLILTDMLGGTPTNIATMFLADENIEIITGVNLPMVIKLATQEEGVSLDDLSAEIQKHGKEGIYSANNILAPQKLRKDA